MMNNGEDEEDDDEQIMRSGSAQVKMILIFFQIKIMNKESIKWRLHYLRSYIQGRGKQRGGRNWVRTANDRGGTWSDHGEIIVWFDH